MHHISIYDAFVEALRHFASRWRTSHTECHRVFLFALRRLEAEKKCTVVELQAAAILFQDFRPKSIITTKPAGQTDWSYSEFTVLFIITFKTIFNYVLLLY